MTWVKGATTWANLANDLTKLIVGEKADDSAVTVASGDRWVRCYTRSVADGVLNSTTTVTSATAAFTAADVGSQVIGTGIPVGATIASVTNGTTVVLSAAATATSSGVSLQICLDTIRTSAAKDVASGNMSNRSGYWTVCDSGATPSLSGAVSSVCKQTAPYSSDPSTSGFHRWATTVTIQTANTVAGNYSTARFAVLTYDADSGALITNSSVQIPTAGGVCTLANGATVTISDPSGFVAVNTKWVRGFSATYMYGIDLWPMLSRQGASGPTFSVAPSGVAATDYDIVQQVSAPNSTAPLAGIRGGYHQGLGIKTATGNSGALYTASWPLAMHKGRIFNSGTAGTLSLDVGDSKVDIVNGNALRGLGVRITGWCKAWATAGSVTGSSAVQYFLSVTADGIVFVLNADPGSTGKLATAFFGSFTPIDSTYDVMPTSFNVVTLDFTGDQATLPVLACQYNYWTLRRLQDGSEGSRDWQTKWMRGEGLTNPFSSGGYGTDVINVSSVSVTPGVSALMQLSYVGPNQTSLSGASAIPSRQNKPSIDGKWWLYGYQFGEGSWDLSASLADENRIMRATCNRIFYAPGDGWSSGDELTDTVSGLKYLLVMPDYLGVGTRVRVAASSFQGGVAVAEL